MNAFDVEHPWVLILLPLALLPLLPGTRHTLAFPWLPWLPHDRLGRVAGALFRVFGVLAIAGTVLALAGPGQPSAQVPRVGRGAEILVLIDRSRSMDERMLPDDWRSIDPLSLRAVAGSRGTPKGQAARDLLAKFVTERRDDRFALMFFSGGPILAVPFTQHDTVVQAGIAAGGIGRGLSNTDVGRALLAAIDEFAPRAYTGSRIILMVSDGGANLDTDTQERITAGMRRHRIGLNWIYLRSINGPTLEMQERTDGTTPELALHNFFQGMGVPYAAYQADHPEDLARAVADVGKHQNAPLDYLEAVPRRDFSTVAIVLAALGCAGLLAHRALSLKGWR